MRTAARCSRLAAPLSLCAVPTAFRMTNHRKRQTRDVDHDEDKDERPCDAPNPSGSPVPDSATPVFQSEDDDALVDEDASG